MSEITAKEVLESEIKTIFVARTCGSISEFDNRYLADLIIHLEDLTERDLEDYFDMEMDDDRYVDEWLEIASDKKTEMEDWIKDIMPEMEGFQKASKTHYYSIYFGIGSMEDEDP